MNMATTLTNPAVDGHLLNSEIRRRMAKVHDSSHRKTESLAALRAEIGGCIDRARCLAGLTLEQFADGIGRDASQVGKWIRNAEPPQIEAVLMSPFRGEFLQALAERTNGCEVVTEIRVVRRSA